MALQNILDAIVDDADKRIADLTAAHKQYLKELREDSERRLARKRSQITEQRDQRMRQMKEKTESHARMSRSKALLTRRQEYMDRLYTEALDQLVSLPKDKTEAFLAQCLKQIKGKGTIMPAKAHEAILKKLLPTGCTMGETIDAVGGFRFASDTEEHDFSYEFLIHRLLREKTEVSAAEMLFPANA
jgi:vacuolar-type H+-ATPase subunit E/Vma4